MDRTFTERVDPPRPRGRLAAFAGAGAAGDGSRLRIEDWPARSGSSPSAPTSPHGGSKPAGWRAASRWWTTAGSSISPAASTAWSPGRRREWPGGSPFRSPRRGGGEVRFPPVRRPRLRAARQSGTVRPPASRETAAEPVRISAGVSEASSGQGRTRRSAGRLPALARGPSGFAPRPPFRPGRGAGSRSRQPSHPASEVHPVPRVVSCRPDFGERPSHAETQSGNARDPRRRRRARRTHLVDEQHPPGGGPGRTASPRNPPPRSREGAGPNGRAPRRPRRHRSGRARSRGRRRRLTDRHALACRVPPRTHGDREPAAASFVRPLAGHRAEGRTRASLARNVLRPRPVKGLPRSGQRGPARGPASGAGRCTGAQRNAGGEAGVRPRTGPGP